MLIHQQGEISHYARKADAPNVALRVNSARTLLNVINKNFGTIPFCRRYLDRLGQDKYLLGVSTRNYRQLYRCDRKANDRIAEQPRHEWYRGSLSTVGGHQGIIHGTVGACKFDEATVLVTSGEQKILTVHRLSCSDPRSRRSSAEVRTISKPSSIELAVLFTRSFQPRTVTSNAKSCM